LTIPPDTLVRVLAGGIGRQTGQRQLEPRQMLGVGAGQAGMFDQRQRDVFLQVQ